MQRLALTKPDGRALTLYARGPLDPAMTAPSPFAAPLGASPHLRWHPLRGEWVTYAAYRQGRTYRPPPQYNPLAPTRDPAHPTEVPAGDWEAAVFDNRFPALAPAFAPGHSPGRAAAQSLWQPSSHAPANAPAYAPANSPASAPAVTGDTTPALPVPTAPADGACEVVVFTQDADGSLGGLPLDRIELLLEVWGDRLLRLGAQPRIHYVLPFENRGPEVGVTLHHPHGQIYAYPVLPPVPARMREVAQEHWRAQGRGPLTDLIAAERHDGRRLLYEGLYAVAFVPACARYPYEAWVAPLRPVGAFNDLAPPERADLARALKTVLLQYDGLWQRPFPYLLAWYPAPTDGVPDPGWHLHAELLPPYRTPDRLKFLAGTELAAGFFAMDVLPEDKAAELRAVEVRL